MAIQYYAASSLDGFIATPDDSVAFLDEMTQPSSSSYEAFIGEVGAIVMGAATYRFIQRHMAAGNPWPYTQPCWVFTNNPTDDENVHFVIGDIQEHLPAIRAAAGDKNIWLTGGGELVGQFLDAGALDELIISLASCTLGVGKPVLPRRVNLLRTDAIEMGDGFVELRFNVQR